MRQINNKNILYNTLSNFIKHSFKNPRGFRYEIIQKAWILVKSFSAQSVSMVEIGELGLRGTLVEGPVDNIDGLIVAALCRFLKRKTFFEIGTYLGETTLLVAHNNPETQVYTLDLPRIGSEQKVKLELTDSHLFQRWDRGIAFRRTAEANRIVQLYGDSAVFDFSPYKESIDMVFIDGSHSYSYVRSDTEAALNMISSSGIVLWHDYPAYPGIYAYLNELGAVSDRPIVHIKGTGLALYSRQNLKANHPAQLVSK